MNTLNLDPQEIAKFEALAARWWDPQSEFKPLHDINPLRLKYIAERAPLQGANVLDVGCGGGILSESLAAEGAGVTGIDMGEAPLNVARLHLLESSRRVDYQQITAEQMAQTHAGQFDVVTCMEMLEHVPDPASTIAACAALAKPGGQIFFSTINRNPKAFLFAIVGAEYLLNLLPRGTHQYKQFIKPSELCTWARNAHLKLQGLIGMHYNPIAQTYKLNRDVSVNFIAHFSKPTGLHDIHGKLMPMAPHR